MRDVRGDFPLLARHPKLVYLDSACTSLKPKRVIEAEASYYTEFGACAGRSSHTLGRKTNEKLEECRREVASFVNAEPEGLVWTRNATEALNLLLNSFDFSKKRGVVTTVLEHHAVLLPLMRLRDAGRIELEVLGCDSKGEVPPDAWREAIGKETALAVTNSGNNTTGWRQDVKAIAKVAHDAGALICVDGAQGVPHHRTDFKKDDIDFLCFSAHKMLGPTGVGAFAAKGQLLDRMEPFIVGGGIVRTLALDRAEYMQGYSRFEAGIQDYAGIMGFAEACRYLKALGMEDVEAEERRLGEGLSKALADSGAAVYGGGGAGYGATRSFNFSNGRPHDVALMLDKEGIAVRSGFFCAQPAMEAMGAKNGAVRASAYIYNNEDDIRRFTEALGKLGALYS